MTEPTLHAVLFDLDGVVADTMPLHRATWTAFATDLGLRPTPAEIRALDGLRSVEVVRRLCGEAVPPERVAALAQAREARYGELLTSGPVRPVPGIHDFLAALRAAGRVPVLATSAIPANIAYVLGALGLEGAFQGIVDAPQVERGKPDPEVYLTAARLAGFPPAACLVVEDALPGLEAAVAAGCPALGIMTSEDEGTLRARGARWVARDFTALPPGLRRALGQ